MSAGNFIPFDVGGALAPVISPQNAAQLPVCSDSAAATVAVLDDFPDWGKGADFRQFQRVRGQSVAIVATVAGVEGNSLPWSDGLARLEVMPPPLSMQPDQWEELIWISLKTSREWGDRAHGLGWSTINLYGRHPDPAISDTGMFGLAPLLHCMNSPLTIVGIERELAELRDRQGHILRYRRKDMPRAIPIWEA